MNIEFKKSTTDITKDVYETVCAFSNREGGHILLGVKDDGTVIGVDRNRAERIRSDFVTSINNPNKMYPPLYLMIENIEYDDKLIIYIFNFFICHYNLSNNLTVYIFIIFAIKNNIKRLKINHTKVFNIVFFTGYHII